MLLSEAEVSSSPTLRSTLSRWCIAAPLLTTSRPAVSAGPAPLTNRCLVIRAFNGIGAECGSGHVRLFATASELPSGLAVMRLPVSNHHGNVARVRAPFQPQPSLAAMMLINPKSTS